MVESQNRVLSDREIRSAFASLIDRYIDNDQSKLEYLAKRLGVSKRMIYSYWGGEKFPKKEKFLEILFIVNS